MMIAIVYWLPTNGLMADADWLIGSKVGSHWRSFCSHHVNLVNSRSVKSTMTAP